MLGICRQSLQPSTMEACMCVRSWLRSSCEEIGEGKAEKADPMNVEIEDHILMVVVYLV